MNSTPTSTSLIEKQDKILKRTLFVVFGITLFILLFFLFRKDCCGWSGVMVVLIAACASASVGAAIGFLFGMPRATKFRFIKKDDFDHLASETYYSDNANLEEVSDWLTKIILGLTLVKFKTIQYWIHLAANNIDGALAVDDCKVSYYVFGYCLIVFYFLVGGGITYLWARTKLGILFTQSRKEQTQSQELTQAITAIQHSGNQALAETTTANIANLVDMNILDNPANERVIAFQAKIRSVYNSKSTYDKTDIQKSRWGGKSQVSDFVLEAVYDGLYPLLNIYKLKLIVRSTNPNNPIIGEVAYFLHDTFPAEIVFKSAVDNKAEIELAAYEAFVAGARLENGTELELDLNTVKAFPSGFYWR